MMYDIYIPKKILCTYIILYKGVSKYVKMDSSALADTW